MKEKWEEYRIYYKVSFMSNLVLLIFILIIILHILIVFLNSLDKGFINVIVCVSIVFWLYSYSLYLFGQYNLLYINIMQFSEPNLLKRYIRTIYYGATYIYNFPVLDKEDSLVPFIQFTFGQIYNVIVLGASVS